MLFAQTGNSPVRKHALVIGNGNYTGLTRLANPVNDADDMAGALQSLGFSVEKLINANLDQMDSAIMRLKDHLSESSNSYGFFFYAGHGVQSGGENYLVPVDANIPRESFLRSRSLSVQTMLDELNDAGNSLNVVVLDACRDNPFGWGRSTNRGLVVVNYQPADSIIVYASSAGQIAGDGTGRNGLFTSQLLPNLLIPGIEVAEVFRRTGADVAEISARQQIPAVYNQFFGTAYLGSRPIIPSVFQAGAASVATGSLEIITATAGIMQIIGDEVNETVELPAWATLPIEKINAGSYRIVMSYKDGRTEVKNVQVGREDAITVEFIYRPAPLPDPRPPRNSPAGSARLWTVGASVGSSFSAPWLIATLEGTIAPFRYSFFDLGMDVGMLSGDRDVNHFSLYPFVRCAFFYPLGGGGWYAGAGAGLMIANYTFPEGKVSRNIWTADITTGYIFRFGLTASYSFRTDFKSVNHKVAVGYSFRFKSNNK